MLFPSNLQVYIQKLCLATSGEEGKISGEGCLSASNSSDTDSKLSYCLRLSFRTQWGVLISSNPLSEV